MQSPYDRTWRKVRQQVLNAEPTCRMCRQMGHLTPATVVDHIVKVKDAPELRLDPTNLQPLCAFHHNSTKAAIEARGYDGAVDEDGWPICPNHPANRGRGGAKT